MSARRGCYCAGAVYQRRLFTPPAVRLGTKDCTPGIDTSEIMVDCHWDFPMDAQWHFPTGFHLSAVCSKGCHFSGGCSLELSNGCSVAFSNGISCCSNLCPAASSYFICLARTQRGESYMRGPLSTRKYDPSSGQDFRPCLISLAGLVVLHRLHHVRHLLRGGPQRSREGGMILVCVGVFYVRMCCLCVMLFK